MIKTIEQLEKELDDKIPRSAVEERDGGGGRKLSYLTGHYVIDRLNKVFGHLNWGKEILEAKEVVNKTNRGEFPAYLVKLRLTVQVPLNDGSGLFKHVVKEGYGYGADKSNLNAHELAIKEAVTDALKVAAKDLGQSMGLALYSRDQENVDDNEHKADNVIKMEIDHGNRRGHDSKEVSKPQIKIEPKSPDTAGTSKDTETGGGESKAASVVEPNAAKLEEAIRTYVRIADKQKKLTVEAFKAYLTQSFGVGKLAELDASQLKTVYDYLKNLTK